MVGEQPGHGNQGEACIQFLFHAPLALPMKVLNLHQPFGYLVPFLDAPSRVIQIRLLQEYGLRLLLAARAGDHPHLQAQLDRSDAPWFADPSPEGQERDRQLRVVPEVELNAANPDLKVQVLQSSERRGSGEDARRGVHLGHRSAAQSA